MNEEKIEALRNSTACKRVALFDKIANSTLLSGEIGYDNAVMYLTDAYENAPEFKSAIDGVMKVCGELKVWSDVAKQDNPFNLTIKDDEAEDEDEDEDKPDVVYEDGTELNIKVVKVEGVNP